MLTMILKMTGITALYVLLTMAIWKWTQDRKLRFWEKLLIGLVYGGCSVLSTHFAIDYSHMLLNVRDLGPLSLPAACPPAWPVSWRPRCACGCSGIKNRPRSLRSSSAR